VCKLEYIFKHPAAWGAISLIIIFIIMCMLPFHVFYLRSRLEVLKTLGHILISPFGPVKFKDFFLADIITSMVPTLRDLIMLTFFFASGQWYHLEEWSRFVDPKED
jgi:hypothetical protein